MNIYIYIYTQCALTQTHRQFTWLHISSHLYNFALTEQDELWHAVHCAFQMANGPLICAEMCVFAYVYFSFPFFFCFVSALTKSIK